jgi:pimeloyl-ACP methyl ester carboxylesterase
LRGAINRILFREVGDAKHVVLVHGLGMSSKYFERLAQCLFDRGLHSVAPDLPGFGESDNAPPRSPEEHARTLVEWADALNVRGALWVGHSVGCDVVAHVARMRPDIASSIVCVGPLWTRSRHPALRLCGCIVLDALREPLSLYAHVIPAYCRTGVWRWWATFIRSVPDFLAAAPSAAVFVAGERDPLPDSSTLAEITRVPGAHACLYSYPAEVAEIIEAVRQRLPVPRSPGTA